MLTPTLFKNNKLSFLMLADIVVFAGEWGPGPCEDCLDDHGSEELVMVGEQPQGARELFIISVREKQASYLFFTRLSPA